MSAIHISKDGDMVDLIAFEYYGTEEGRKAIYDANEGLANRGLVLEADIEIVIPDWTAPASEVPTGGIAS
jgi:phage tail protein X